MLKNRPFALLAFATLAASSMSARAQAAPLDAETGLPVTAAFQFPASPAVVPFWSERRMGYLTTADGVRLRYSVLLPKRTGRVPVILFINGYDAGSIGGLAYRQARTAQVLALDRQLLEAGYAVMGVNPAGTGCSEGQLEYIRPQLGRHAAEAVEFAARQSWSDARVGMMGYSYAGSSQLAAAQSAASAAAEQASAARDQASAAWSAVEVARRQAQTAKIANAIAITAIVISIIAIIVSLSR